MIDIHVMTTKTTFRGHGNGEGQEHGNEPGQDDDVVIPSDSAYDSDARYHSSRDKEGSQAYRHGGDDEDGGPSVGNVSCLVVRMMGLHFDVAAW